MTKKQITQFKRIYESMAMVFGEGFIYGERGNPKIGYLSEYVKVHLLEKLYQLYMTKEAIPTITREFQFENKEERAEFIEEERNEMLEDLESSKEYLNYLSSKLEPEIVKQLADQAEFFLKILNCVIKFSAG